MACAGSALAEEGLEDQPTLAAAYGTRLHEAAARALEGGLDADELRELDDDEEGQAIVQAYLNEVRMAHALYGGELLVEKQFTLASLSPHLWGTADAVILAPPVLIVFDLKTGGHFVRAVRPDGSPNVQLAGYALGALEMAPDDMHIHTIHIRVVQPRNGGVMGLELHPADLFDLAADLAEVVERGLKPGAPRASGPHCRYCRAAFSCPELRQLAQQTARTDFAELTPTLPAPEELAPADIADILSKAEVLDVWIGAVRAHALREAERGRAPPGFKLVARRGRRRWAEGQEEAAARLLRNIGLSADEIYTSPQLRSPAQIEQACKLMKVPPPAAKVWAQLVTQSDPGRALVPEADPRPAIAAGPGAEFRIETEDQ